jgi:hypothetical protein
MEGKAASRDIEDAPLICEYRFTTFSQEDYDIQDSFSLRERYDLDSRFSINAIKRMATDQGVCPYRMESEIAKS